MRKPIVIGLGLAALGAAGIITSRVIGSMPEEPDFDGPLPTCDASPNCYRARRVIAADPDTVRAAARDALDASANWMTGRPIRVTPTDDGFRAVIKVGPMRDDLQVAVLPGAAGQSVVHIRSAARLGESDLGVNRLRARRLLDRLAERFA